MKENSRRAFIKKTSLGMGVLGTSSLDLFSETIPPTTSPSEPDLKTVYLWDDDSVNNGPDPKKRPKLDFFIPKTKGPEKRAAIIVCPGGGYGGLAAHEGSPFAKLFSSAGIVSAVLTYRVSPNRYPAPYSDAVRAMRILRSRAEEFNIDPEKIGIIGFSAGGHLASTVACQPDLFKDPLDGLAGKISARPNRVILGYPVISFDEFTHKGSVGNFLGSQSTPELIRQFSNQKQVTASTPPAFLFHTANDQAVPVENSLLFAEACAKNKVPFALHIYPNGPHGVGTALKNPELSGWTEVMLKWLSEWQRALA